jgi:hypothetical protein
MSAVNTLTCANCANPFPAPPFIRGKPQRFYGRACQTRAANMRRSIKRRGSAAQRPCDLSTAVAPPERPLPSTLPDAPAKVQTPLSGHASTASSVDRSRLEELMEKAHSRVGVTAWETAEIARARNISPWAPLAKIIAR